MRRLAFAILVLSVAAPSIAEAQAANRLPRVLDLPMSTRAMALGDAYMMNAGHADAIFYHPSLLTSARGFGLEMQRWTVESSATALSAATQWLGGTIGVGLLSLQYSGPNGDPVPEGQDHLFGAGGTPVSERVAVLGYATQIAGFDVGVNGKLVDERLDGNRSDKVMVDIGIGSDVGPLAVALTVRDWGEDPIAPGSSMPRIVLGAGAYGQQIGELDIGITAAVNRTEDRTTISGGLEAGYWPIRGRTFVARVGFQDAEASSDMGPLSFGFAFWGDNVTAEWAFRPYSGPESAGTHRFGLRWR